MFDDAFRSQIKSYLERLKRDVVLTTYLDSSETAGSIRELVSVFQEASPRVSVVAAADGAPGPDGRVPAFSVGVAGEAPRVHFGGAPLGHEISSLILAVLHVGGHPPKESEATLQQADQLAGRYKFETYFSASCQNCPDVVQALNLLASRNPGIEHIAIDGGSFRDEVERRQVMAVPSVFLNGEPFAQGRMDLSEVLAKLDSGAESRAAEALSNKGVFDMLVVGGGPAGAAAAVYAVRKGISTGLVADKFGGQVQDTLAIENFISVSDTDGPRLTAAMEAHVATYPVDVMKHQRATKLVPGETISIELESGATLRAKSVILATGARYRDMNVPGEQEYRTRGVTYCPHCDGPLFKGKEVAVIGGGNSGVEAAIDLAGVVAHVTLLEYLDELKADAVLQRKLESLSNVTVIKSAQVTAVLGDGQKVTGLAFTDRASGDKKELTLAGIFVQIGLLPNTAWLKDTVELTRFGEIVVGPKGETSVPGVFAAGDVTATPFKQIIIAAGDGAKAALGAFEYMVRRPAA